MNNNNIFMSIKDRSKASSLTKRILYMKNGGMMLKEWQRNRQLIFQSSRQARSIFKIGSRRRMRRWKAWSNGSWTSMPTYKGRNWAKCQLKMRERMMKQSMIICHMEDMHHYSRLSSISISLISSWIKKYWKSIIQEMLPR